MVICCVSGCKSRSEIKEPGVSFHRIHMRDTAIRQKWLENINKPGWHPTKYSRICSKHFEKHCFYHLGNKVYLLDEAVPTIFKHSPKYLKSVKREQASPVPDASTLGLDPLAIDSPSEQQMNREIEENEIMFIERGILEQESIKRELESPVFHVSTSALDLLTESIDSPSELKIEIQEEIEEDEKISTEINIMQQKEVKRELVSPVPDESTFALDPQTVSNDSPSEKLEERRKICEEIRMLGQQEVKKELTSPALHPQTELTDDLSEQQLKRKLQYEIEKSKTKSYKIRTLGQKVKRYKQRIASLKSIAKELKQQGLLCSTNFLDFDSMANVTKELQNRKPDEKGLQLCS